MIGVANATKLEVLHDAAAGLLRINTGRCGRLLLHSPTRMRHYQYRVGHALHRAGLIEWPEEPIVQLTEAGRKHLRCRPPA
jgi:hypothetical protein